MSTQIRVRLKVRMAWWWGWYASGVAAMAVLTHSEPDLDMVMRFALRAAKVTVEPIGDE